MRNIGEKVKFYREQQNITQAQLAEEVDVDRSNISKIETGESSGSLPLLFRIADALGVTVAELLGDEQAATRSA